MGLDDMRPRCVVQPLDRTGASGQLADPRFDNAQLTPLNSPSIEMYRLSPFGALGHAVTKVADQEHVSCNAVATNRNRGSQGIARGKLEPPTKPGQRASPAGTMRTTQDNQAQALLQAIVEGSDDAII